jgi:mannitol/fructose-specific phosphotransferase system IIA component
MERGSMGEPAAALLDHRAVRMGCTATGYADAINQCGSVLVEIGSVEPAYVDAMHQREASVSTYLGEGVAIPHGTDESRVHILRTSLAVLQFPDGVDWHGDDVRFCIAIAARGSEHLGVLSSLATILLEPDQVDRLRSAIDVETIVHMLQATEPQATV